MKKKITSIFLKIVATACIIALLIVALAVFISSVYRFFCEIPGAIGYSAVKLFFGAMCSCSMAFFSAFSGGYWIVKMWTSR